MKIYFIIFVILLYLGKCLSIATLAYDNIHRVRIESTPSPPLDNIRVIVIVWRLRGNINFQNSSVLDCVAQCSQSAVHLHEQFLQVKRIGFVILEPLRFAYRRLPRVVLL